MTARPSPVKPAEVLRRAAHPPVREARFWVVQAMVILIAAAHLVVDLNVTAETRAFPEGIPVAMLIIPVGYAALRYGLSGSAATGIWATVLWLPDLLLPNDRGHAANDLVSLALVDAVAFFFGQRIEAERLAHARVRQLEDARLLATIEERERIARDMHDDLGQLLGFLTAKIQAMQELLAHGDTVRAGEELAGLETASRTLSTRVREAILGLRARAGPGRPLGEALADYVADYEVLAGIQTVFETTPGAGAALPGPAAYQVLQIAQEALSNVRRHAGARRVTVRLAETAGGLELSVIDDGVGIGRDNGSGGFGLRTMSERARGLGGSFEALALPDAGTLVRVSLPTGGG